MAETIERKELEDLQQDLDGVRELLRRHRLVESLVERQHSAKHELVETLVHKQHLAELRAKLDEMHPADVAYILEALPINERIQLVLSQTVQFLDDSGAVVATNEALDQVANMAVQRASRR